MPVVSGIFIYLPSHTCSQVSKRILTALCRFPHNGQQRITFLTLHTNIAPTLVDPISNQPVNKRLLESMLQCKCSPFRGDVPAVSNLVIIKDHICRQRCEDLPYPSITCPCQFIEV